MLGYTVETGVLGYTVEAGALGYTVQQGYSSQGTLALKLFSAKDLFQPEEFDCCVKLVRTDTVPVHPIECLC